MILRNCIHIIILLYGVQKNDIRVLFKIVSW